MPLSPIETARIHDAAAAAAAGTLVKWHVGSDDALTLDWVANGHTHRVCSSLDGRSFAGLLSEARQVFLAEYERLTRPRKVE